MPNSYAHGIKKIRNGNAKKIFYPVVLNVYLKSNGKYKNI